MSEPGGVMLQPLLLLFLLEAAADAAMDRVPADSIIVS
jgi:hypothetical protein